MSFAKYNEDNLSIMNNRTADEKTNINKTIASGNFKEDIKMNTEKKETMNDYVYQEPRTLPVFLLLDSSGSMDNNNNIGIMNEAVNEMIGSFKKLDSTNAKISVSIIAFGGSKAEIKIPLTYASDVPHVNLSANGNTPLGSAILAAKELIENKEIVTSRSYRPVVVLVSDGMPNDLWQQPMKDFIETGRTAKCYRMAMSIGAEENTPQYQMLQSFLSKEETVHTASEAIDIVKFFKYVTMSVGIRSQSQNPNVVPDAKATSSKAFSDLDIDKWLR